MIHTHQTRHQARQAAFQFLYQADLEASEFTPDTLHEKVDQYFSHFQVPQDLQSFSKQLICGTIAHCSELDSDIEKNAENWKIKRMAVVDRNLLRLALFEIKHLEESPIKVSIDEAIELAKDFGTEDSPPFINGILDSMIVKTPEEDLTEKRAALS